MNQALLAALAAAAGCQHATQPAPANVGPPASPVLLASLAPTPPPPPDPLALQLERGKALYAEHCAKCHGDRGEGDGKAPALVGAGALPLDAHAGYNRDQKFRTAADVFAWASREMPGDDPGSLAIDEYLAILAFGLSANGVKLERALDLATAPMIVLHP